MSGSIQSRMKRGVLLYGIFVTVVIVCIALFHGPLTRAFLWIDMAWTFVLFLLVLLLVAFYWLYRNLIGTYDKQIERMTELTREMASREAERKIDLEEIEQPDLRRLAEAINLMADRAKRDIAEMKRLERVRSEFLANVSHELRTPIFSVQGYLETLIDGAVNDPNVRYDFLNKAHSNVLRLHTLLTDLIEISRIESGEMKMSFRYFDALDVFRGLIEELRPTAEMADVSLELRLVGDLNASTSVYGDRDRIKQVLVNLIENAIKYNHPQGNVIVELEPVPNEAIVRVVDTGIGIPEQDLGRIFERFYRVNKDRSRSVGGSGLGLAIVKHIIEAHNTTIHVQSTPGIGTTFSFRLKRN